MKLKHHFKLLFSGLTTKIKGGPLKGKKWVITAGGHFVKGDFEKYKVDSFLQHYDQGEVFFDIGAHVGYFTSLAANRTREEQKIFAFEPRPMNIQFFKKHIQLNNFNQVKLFESAVGAEEGIVRFDDSKGSATGSVSATGDIEVHMISVDKMVANNELPKPGFIKIDVEGGELEVLKGCENTIEKNRPKLLIATHGEKLHKEVIRKLDQLDYQYEILNQDGAHGDTEIMAIPK